MSQREKRLAKKVKEISLLGVDKQKIKDYMEQMEAEMQEAQMLLEQIDMQEHELEHYVTKKEDSQMFTAEHKLVDGTPLEVLVIQEGRSVIVSTMGLVAKAKAHESDVFVFEIGYQLALNRLIEQYLNLVCEYNCNLLRED